MTTTRDPDNQLSGYLQWVVDFLQNLQRISPAEVGLHKIERVVQDSFYESEQTKSTIPAAGVKDISACDDLAFNALRRIDQKRRTSNDAFDENTFKEYANEFADLISHILTREKQIYQEVMNMQDDQYNRLFGNIKDPQNPTTTPSREQVAKDIAKGYGFGIFQHYVAMYGDMMVKSRDKDEDQLKMADMHFIRALQRFMTEFPKGNIAMDIVTNNKDVIVDKAFVDRLADEALKKNNEEAKKHFTQVNTSNKKLDPMQDKHVKLSSKIANNTALFEKK